MKKRNQSCKRFVSKLSSATDRKRHYRISLFFMLVLGVFLSGYSGLSGEKVEEMRHTPRPITEDLFERYEIVTGSARHQTVLPGVFLGGAFANIAVASIENNRGPHLRIYAFEDGTWVTKIDASLRPKVLLVDVARIGGRDRLITYESGRLNWFDPHSASEKELVAVAFDYTEPTEGGIPFVDITRDVTGDGRDDLVIPGTDGFRVFVQKNDGVFADPVKLGPPEPHLNDTALMDNYSYGEMGISPISIPWYLGRVHELDYNRDGRRDIVFWNKDHFDVYFQDESGMFPPVAKTFTTEVAFDSDGEYSLQYGFRMEDIKLKALHSFSDLNGDRVADLVTMSLEGPGIFKRTTFEVYFGRPTPGGTLFARDADSAIKSDGIQRGMRRHDLDRDGQVDLKFTTINLGDIDVAEMHKIESFSYLLRFYRMEDGVYPEEPNATRELTTTRGFSPPVLIGDVNGDSLSDLLVGNEREELHVFLGVPGPDLLTRRPQKLAVAMPGNSEEDSIDFPYSPNRLVDLNKDEKQDILIHHASTTEPHRVTILIAR